MGNHQKWKKMPISEIFQEKMIFNFNKVLYLQNKKTKSFFNLN